MSDDDPQSLFLDLIDEHGSCVMKVARAYTLNSEECQDLAQEILLQAWQSLSSFEGRSAAATWLYRVALHTAMNWHRKDRPRRLRQQPFLDFQAVVREEPDSAEQSLQRETVEQLYKAIHQLPKTDASQPGPLRTYFWHNGSNTMWYAFVVFAPEMNMVIAVTANDGDSVSAEAAAWEIVTTVWKEWIAKGSATSEKSVP